MHIDALLQISAFMWEHLLEVISSEEGLLYTVRWDEHDEDEEVETEGFTVEDIKAPAGDVRERRLAKFRQNLARFRLYRLRFLQENMRFAAFSKSTRLSTWIF